MSAILRVTFSASVPKNISAHSKLKPYRYDENTLHYLVADDETSWAALCKAVQLFLTKHHSELQEIVSAEGVENSVLDVASHLMEDFAAKHTRVNNDLLREIAELGLDLEISTYKTT